MATAPRPEGQKFNTPGHPPMLNIQTPADVQEGTWRSLNEDGKSNRKRFKKKDGLYPE